MIRRGEPDDYGEIFTLQRAAFVDEARIYETPFVPSLNMTFEQFRARMEASTSWVFEVDGRIIGGVSLRECRDGGPDVERLMVAPDCRGRGMSSQLLRTVEDFARSNGHPRIQLIVGDLAVDNRAIYSHLGWVQHSSETLAGFEHVLLHTLAKDLS